MNEPPVVMLEWLEGFLSAATVLLKAASVMETDSYLIGKISPMPERNSFSVGISVLQMHTTSDEIVVKYATVALDKRRLLVCRNSLQVHEYVSEQFGECLGELWLKLKGEVA